MEYGYRTSMLKRVDSKSIVLSTELGLKKQQEEVSAKIRQFSEHRKATQPPGASRARCSRIRQAIMLDD